MLIRIRNALIHTYFRLKRPMTMGVRIVLINKNNEICLVRHTYTKGWHLPGGGIEKGETALKAAIKEVAEETGIILNESNLILRSIHANFINFKGDHVLIYHAQNFDNNAVPAPHAIKEIAEAKFFPITTLPDGVTGGTTRRINEAIGKSDISENW